VVVAEGPELLQHRVGRPGRHVELDGIAVRLPRGPGEHHHVADPGLGDEPGHQLLSGAGCADDAYV
jgi:hypothetical protein